ncbi:hypothetical protein HUU42_01505 [bacterium]|nr:hypothetical protein [bacterium]
MKSFLLVLSVCLAAACSQPLDHAGINEKQLDQYLSQYAPYPMVFDASGYNEKDKTILKKLIQAADYLDTIYWQQTSKYALQLRDSLSQIKNNRVAEKLLTLVKRNAGPWEALNDNATFYGQKNFYPGQEFYPNGMTSEKFDQYLATLPEDQKKEFMYPYTVIREDGKGGYKAVRYHEEYKPYIDKIAALLNECADLSDDSSFAKVLRLKAQSLATDNYFDADVAWIDMNSSKFDLVFGPYETYADGIKGVKAKYEAYIEIIDQEESAKLEVYKKYLKDMEENLPVPKEYKSVVEGLTAKFVIVRDIYRAGEAIVAYQAVATNLPNDAEVHAKKGTKKTFWKNMLEARFNTIIRPVSMRLIDTAQTHYLSEQGFFQFVLMHEICHAVGPRVVKTGSNKGMSVNAAIGPDYNALEEAKADIAGMHSLVYLMDKGVVEKEKEKYFYVSYLGTLFRSIRFGANQAHGKASFVALNYLTQKGAIRYDEATKRWSVEFDKMRSGIKDLATDLLMLLGDGDTKKVKAFFDQWAYTSPQLQASLDAVKDIAVDVLPTYSIKWD